MKKPTVGFIGAGKVGTALAARLSQSGYPVIGASDTNVTSAEEFASLVTGSCVFRSPQQVADNAAHIFITTPDDLIPTVASELTWRPEHNVVHCSGAASTDILEPAERIGAMVGSFHPCQAFASVTQAIENLPGSTFAIEALGPLREVLTAMASAMGCDWIVLKPGDKPLYHAAAVFASNYFVALLKVSTKLFEHFDVPRDQAVKVLMPLIQGNMNNIKQIGLPHCLTGPIARGDVGTIQKHISSLQKREPSLLKLYAELGLQTVPIALEKGTIDERIGEALERLFKTAIEGGG
jgi:predicted short-subunit dehydrogenase-like oxidoreductase (DUF2520 family)